MWTLIIMFLAPHVGTATATDFYTKGACLEAKTQIEKLDTTFLKAVCVDKGDTD